MSALSTLRSAHPEKLRSTFTLSGCRPFAMTDTHLIDYEGRYEYWEDGVAWELGEPSLRHEWPRSRLVEIIGDIAKMRGTPIALLGTTGLQERDARGTRLRAVQADELVCLDWRYGLPDVFVVGELPLPDVVFEVDLTTDIRDRKLDVYAAWGVPELWVEVPDAGMPSKRKRPGLTILLLDDGAFRESAESAAFPTLSAREIHAALNEPSMSRATVETVRRVGGIMGRRTGTGPDDDPFLSVERRLSRREGHHEGHRQGRRDERISMLQGLLGARGINITPRLRAEAHRIAALPPATVLGAALDSTDLDDFLRRLQL
ncbi:MAG: Uma2 family endonuclease [Gammaproteobacteria bacterium]|nr:Uma2 family endonuclease [Gammaproteobacteria bacterium]